MRLFRSVYPSLEAQSHVRMDLLKLAGHHEAVPYNGGRFTFENDTRQTLANVKRQETLPVDELWCVMVLIGGQSSLRHRLNSSTLLYQGNSLTPHILTTISTTVSVMPAQNTICEEMRKKGLAPPPGFGPTQEVLELILIKRHRWPSQQLVPSHRLM